MEKLIKEQLRPFLFTGLKVKLEFKEGSEMPWYYDTDELVELSGMILDWYGNDITKITPVMNNLSCLTKTIQHEGREFCPLIELAKIAGLSGDFRIEHEMLISSEGDVFYLSGSISWVLRRHGERFTVSNQYQLFQKLAEWHINFVGIPEGLYIDKNTLK